MSSYTKILTALKNHLKVLALLILTTICFYDSYAQKDSKEKKHRREAYDLFLQERFSEAKPILYQLQTNHRQNFDYNYGLAICLLYEGNDSSSFYFSQCLSLAVPHPDKLFFYLGKSYQMNNQFHKAIVYYNTFLSKISTSKELDYSERKKLKQWVLEDLVRCKQGVLLLSSHNGETPKNLGPTINSPFSEYAPLLNYDENRLIYTATKPDIYSEKEHIKSRNYTEDVFFANRTDSSDQWVAQHLIPTNQKKKRSQAGLFLSLSGQRLIYYEAKEHSSKVKLYDKDLQNNRWIFPQKFAKKLHRDYDIKSFFLSHDERIIIFSSNIQGGYGGLDLYIMTKGEDEQWTLPKNMGPMINSSFDEDTPNLLPDNTTLLFCSNSLQSMGGYDIFISQAKSFGDWNIPTNLGHAVNSGTDDMFPCVGFKTNQLYFSSHRMGGIGKDDIYKVSLDSILSPYIPCKIENKYPNDLITEIKYESAPFGLTRTLEPNEHFTYYLPIETEMNFSASFIGQLYEDRKIKISNNICENLLNPSNP